MDETRDKGEFHPEFLTSARSGKHNIAMYTIDKAARMLSQLIEEAASGKVIIIARGRLPVAQLVPIKPVTRRKPGTLRKKLKAKPGAFEPLTSEELKAWGIN